MTSAVGAWQIEPQKRNADVERVVEMVMRLCEALGQVRLMKPWIECSEISVRYYWIGKDVSCAWFRSSEL